MSRTTPLVGFLLFSLCACGAGYRNGAAEQRPEIITGMGATVMYPGEAGPAMPGSAIGPAGSTSSNTTSSAPGTTSGSSTSNGQGVNGPSSQPEQASGASGAGGAPATAAPGSNMMMIGQTTEEASQSEEKKLFLPIGPLFGYPFWIFGKTLGEKADEAKREQMEPKPTAAKSVPSTPDDVERDKLVRENEALRKELERRAQAAPAPSQSAAPRAAIGDELAALERSLSRRGGATTSAPAPVAAGAGALAARPILPAQPGLGAPVATDRNGDGKPDMWTYSENGRPVTQAQDDDFDGRVDRIRHLDAKGRLVSSDEDLNGDGIMETTSIYEDGILARRRTDSDGDGQADTWSFYKGDELLRTEVDKNGDGFRDEITIYEHGQVAREEVDKNGDGRPDSVSIFQNGQLSEKREDIDFDGTPDVVSHYVNGKLSSREAASSEVFEKWENEGGK